MSVTIACVRTGTVYSTKHVARLRNMVNRHLPESIGRRFICLTDQPERVPGVEMVDVSAYGLAGWWAKMLLFSAKIRGPGLCVYFDLDTVIVDDISPLTQLGWQDGIGGLAICGNFTRLAGLDYPCKYGSCCMVLQDGYGGQLFGQFLDHRTALIGAASRLGDQAVIERLEPFATILQNAMPAGFFLGYRDLPKHPRRPPPGCAVVVFGGSHKPDNCDTLWVQNAWQ